MLERIALKQQRTKHVETAFAEATPGARKYEISWMLPEVQDELVGTVAVLLSAYILVCRIPKLLLRNMRLSRVPMHRTVSTCAQTIRPFAILEVWGPRYCSEPGETFDWVRPTCLRDRKACQLNEQTATVS